MAIGRALSSAVLVALLADPVPAAAQSASLKRVEAADLGTVPGVLPTDEDGQRQERVCLNSGWFVLALRAYTEAVFHDGTWLSIALLVPDGFRTEWKDQTSPEQMMAMLVELRAAGGASTVVGGDLRNTTDMDMFQVDEPACFKLHAWAGQVRLFRLLVAMAPGDW